MILRFARDRATLSALCMFIVATLAIGGSTTVHPGSRLLGDTTSDASGVARTLWVLDRQHSTPFTSTRDSYAGAPEGVPLSPALTIAAPLQPGFVWGAAPLLGRIGAINFFLFLGLVASAMAAFLVVRALGMHPVAAFTAGFAIAFGPWSIEQALVGHLAFVHEWPLLILVAALAYADRERTPLSAVVVGGMCAVCFLAAAYTGALGSVLALCGGAVIFGRSRGAERLWACTLACIAIATTVVVLTPALLAYLHNRAQTLRIAAHGANEGSSYSVSPSDYLNPSPHLALLGYLHQGSRSLAFGQAEHVVFAGYSLIILALVGAWLTIRRSSLLVGPNRFALLTCLVAVPVCVVLSLPPSVRVGGISLALPSSLVEHVTTFYRVYARFSFVATIGLALLGAAAIHAAARRSTIWAVALAAIVVVELWPGALPSWSARQRPLDRWFADRPSAIVADYPQPTDRPAAARLALTQAAFQSGTGDRQYTLLSGGTAGTREQAIRIVTRYVTDPRTPGLLAAEHVNYVVLHDDIYRADGDTPPAAPPSLRLVRRFPGVRIYALRPDTPPANIAQVLDAAAAEIAAVQGLVAPSLTLISGWSPAQGGAADASALAETGGRIELASSDTRVTRALIILKVSSPAGPRTLDVADADGHVLQKFTVGGSDAQIAIGPVATPTPHTDLTLSVEGQGTSSPTSERLIVTPLLVQPLADTSTSIAAG